MALAPRRRSLMVQVVATFLVAVGLPLAAAAALGWRYLSLREQEGTARGLTNVGVAVARQVEDHLGKHLDAVRALARDVEDRGDFEPGIMSGELETCHDIYPGFHTLVAVDAAGNAFAGHPRTLPGGTPIRFPVSVADRDYYRRPMADGKPFISPVFLGRGYGQHPIVAVSAPVVRGGVRVGVVEGSLDVAQLPLLEGLVGEEKFDIVVADDTGTVVFATARSGLAPLQPLGDLPVGRAPRAGPGRVFSYRAAGVDQVAVEVPIGAGGWQVVVQQPERVVSADSRSFLLTMLVIFSSGVLLSVLLGAAAAGRAARLLVQLETSVRRFLTGEAPTPIALHASTPREVADLVAGYEEMQRRLGKTLSGLLPVCAWCKRIKDDEGGWHSMESYVRAHSTAEITHGMCADCAARFDEAGHHRREKKPAR